MWRVSGRNTISLVHGLRSARLAKRVDQYRVALLDQLFAERGGRDALDVCSRIAIENYALTCAQHRAIEERLEHDDLFTQQGRRRSAFDMLRSISDTMERLRTQLPPITQQTTPTIDVHDDLSPEVMLARAETLVAYLRDQIATQHARETPSAAIAPIAEGRHELFERRRQHLGDHSPAQRPMLVWD